MRIHTLMIAAALVLSACGEDEKSEPKTVEDEATITQGKAVGEQSTALTTIPAGADQSAGQVAFNQVGTSLQAWVSTYQSAAAREGAPQGSVPGQLTRAQVAEDGQFDFTDNRLTANVTYDSPNGAISYVVDLTIADVEGGKQIDGSFDFSYVGTAGGYNIDYRYDAAYDALTITEGCAASGSITVDYDFEVSGGMLDNLPPEARAQIEDGVGGSGTLTATFGPTCADVSVAGT